MKKIAFILPNYNNEKYILQNISLFSKLSFPNEVIIVDDASTNSKDWIKKIPNEIRVIKNKINQGLGETRNIGVKNVSKDVTHIVFLDADDKIIPKTYNQLFTSIDQNIIFFMSFLNETATQVVPSSSKFCDVGKQNLPRNAWGHIIPVSAIEKNSFRRRTHEDADYIFRLQRDNDYIISRLKAVMYNDYSLSITRSKVTPDKLNDKINLYQYMFANNAWGKRKLQKYVIIYTNYFRFSEKNKLIKPKIKSRFKWILPFIFFASLFLKKEN